MSPLELAVAVVGFWVVVLGIAWLLTDLSERFLPGVVAIVRGRR